MPKFAETNVLVNFSLFTLFALNSADNKTHTDTHTVYRPLTEEVYLTCLCEKAASSPALCRTSLWKDQEAAVV